MSCCRWRYHWLSSFHTAARSGGRLGGGWRWGWVGEREEGAKRRESEERWSMFLSCGRVLLCVVLWSCGRLRDRVCGLWALWTCGRLLWLLFALVAHRGSSISMLCLLAPASHWVFAPTSRFGRSLSLLGFGGLIWLLALLPRFGYSL